MLRIHLAGRCHPKNQKITAVSCSVVNDFIPGMEGFIPLSFNASLNQSASWPPNFDSYSPFFGFSGVSASVISMGYRADTAHAGVRTLQDISRTTPEQLDLFDALSLPEPA